MTESLSHELTRAERIADAIKRGLAFAEVLSRKSEPLAFPGIPPEIVEKLRAVDEQYPGLSTPTLKIIADMQVQGIRVDLGEHRNIHVVPSQSKDVENDGLFPRHLQIVPGMPQELRNLIRLNRISFALFNQGIKEPKQSE